MAYPRFRLAMGQILVEGGKPEANMNRALGAVRRAAAEGAQVIVLPECLDVGWTDPNAPDLAEPIPGPRFELLAAGAAEHGIYVVAGLTERAGKRLYNTAVLISPQGELLHKHRKINELPIAQEFYSIGLSLGVVETPLGVFGINICADNFPSSLAIGHCLARMGAHFIFSPCAWAVKPDFDNTKTPYGAMWRESYGTLARLYDISVVGVSNVGPIKAGPWEGRKCIGCSLAMGPGGREIAQAPYGEMAEAILFVELQAVERRVFGSAYARFLEERGYTGP